MIVPLFLLSINQTFGFCFSYFRVLCYLSWFPCVEIEVIVHMLCNNLLESACCYWHMCDLCVLFHSRFWLPCIDYVHSLTVDCLSLLILILLLELTMFEHCYLQGFFTIADALSMASKATYKRNSLTGSDILRHVLVLDKFAATLKILKQWRLSF